MKRNDEHAAWNMARLAIERAGRQVTRTELELALDIDLKRRLATWMRSGWLCQAKPLPADCPTGPRQVVAYTFTKDAPRFDVETPEPQPIPPRRAPPPKKEPAKFRDKRPPVAKGPVVTPASVKVQVGPCVHFDPRYQVDPATRPFGAGFAAAGVGRDIETGKGWNA